MVIGVSYAVGWTLRAGTVTGLRCLRLVLLGHGFFNLWGRQPGTRTAAVGKEDSGHDEDPDTWSGPCTVEVFQ